MEHLEIVLNRYRSTCWRNNATIEEIESDIQVYNGEIIRATGLMGFYYQQVAYLELSLRMHTDGTECACELCSLFRTSISNIYQPIYLLREILILLRQITVEATALISEIRGRQTRV